MVVHLECELTVEWGALKKENRRRSGGKFMRRPFTTSMQDYADIFYYGTRKESIFL